MIFSLHSLSCGTLYRNLCLLSIVWGAASTQAASSWPQFRGPGGFGLAPDQQLPTSFGPGQQERWKQPLPSGASSPCVWQDFIFLSGHDDSTLRMICLRRSDGQEKWQRSIPGFSFPEYAHVAANPASPTPCTDGKRVYFLFGDYGVKALNFDGEEVWEKKLAPIEGSFGYGTSPVIDPATGLLYINRDGGLDSGLLCLEAATGRTRWFTERRNTTICFATPFLWRPQPADPWQILAAGSGRLESYDASTGQSLWVVKNLPTIVCPSPVADDERVYFGAWTTAHESGRNVVTSAFGEEVQLSESELTDPSAFFKRFDANENGYLELEEFPESRAKDAFNFIDRNHNRRVEMAEWAPFYSETKTLPGRNVFVAIRKGGHGDITSTHVPWSTVRGLPYVATPLLYRNRLYYVKKGGFITCLEPASGKPYFETERLGVGGEYYASPIAVGDEILVASHRGTVFVLRASDALEISRRIEFPEPIYATPAMVDNTLYLRTEKHLWAFAP